MSAKIAAVIFPVLIAISASRVAAVDFLSPEQAEGFAAFRRQAAAAATQYINMKGTNNGDSGVATSIRLGESTLTATQYVNSDGSITIARPAYMHAGKQYPMGVEFKESGRKRYVVIAYFDGICGLLGKKSRGVYDLFDGELESEWECYDDGYGCRLVSYWKHVTVALIDRGGNFMNIARTKNFKIYRVDSFTCK